MGLVLKLHRHVTKCQLSTRKPGEGSLADIKGYEVLHPWLTPGATAGQKLPIFLNMVPIKVHFAKFFFQ